MIRKILFFLGLPMFLLAQSQTGAVTYISAEYIYINTGTGQNFTVGDTVQVSRNGKPVAKLKIVYASENSASCQMLEAISGVQTGDKVINLSTTKTTVTTEAAPTISRTRQFTNTNARKTSRNKWLRGSMAISTYGYQQTSDPGSSYLQPLLRFKLKARDPKAGGLSFELRFQSRFTQRSFDFAESFDADEWDHRLYQAQLSYRHPQSSFGYEAGRLQANWLGGVGRIDGALFDARFASHWKAGLFAGFEPNLAPAEFSTTDRKTGVFLQYDQNRQTENNLSATLALSGSYHQNTINRENLNLQSSYRLHNRLFIYYNMELDINRNWRKEKAGESLSLTSLWLNSTYAFNKQWKLSLGANTRKNYYSYAYRTLADSLFDNANRMGLRGSLSYTPLKGTNITAGGGIQDINQLDLQSQNWFLRLSQYPLLLKYDRANFNYFGFSNQYTKGNYFRLNYNFPVAGRFRLDFGAGLNRYSLDALPGATRQNSWFRIGTDVSLPGNFSVNSFYEFHQGDDQRGSQYLIELYYIF